MVTTTTSTMKRRFLLLVLLVATTVHTAVIARQGAPAAFGVVPKTTTRSLTTSSSIKASVSTLSIWEQQEQQQQQRECTTRGSFATSCRRLSLSQLYAVKNKKSSLRLSSLPSLPGSSFLTQQPRNDTMTALFMSPPSSGSGGEASTSTTTPSELQSMTTSPQREPQRGSRESSRTTESGGVADWMGESWMQLKQVVSQKPPAVNVDVDVTTWVDDESFLMQSTSPSIWAFADLSPDTPDTTGGRLFLASNIVYVVAGILLAVQANQQELACLVEFAAVASFNYHYQQLDWEQAKQKHSVRLALLIDYIAAFSSILFGMYCVVTQTDLFAALGSVTSTSTTTDWWTLLHDPVLEALAVSLTSVGFFFACSFYERGRPYLVLHSIWHILSAYAGYLVGTLPNVLEATSQSTSGAGFF